MIFSLVLALRCRLACLCCNECTSFAFRLGEKKENKNISISLYWSWFLTLFLSVSFRATRKDLGKITLLLLMCSRNWSRATLVAFEGPMKYASQGAAQIRDLHLKPGALQILFCKIPISPPSMPFPVCNLQIKISFKVYSDSHSALFCSTFRIPC